MVSNVTLHVLLTMFQFADTACRVSNNYEYAIVYQHRTEIESFFIRTSFAQCYTLVLALPRPLM